MPHVSGKRIGNMTEDVQWGKEGQFDSWEERGGRGLQIDGERRVAKRTETGSDSFCQKKKNAVEERKMEQRKGGGFPSFHHLACKQYHYLPLTEHFLCASHELSLLDTLSLKSSQQAREVNTIMPVLYRSGNFPKSRNY